MMLASMVGFENIWMGRYAPSVTNISREATTDGTAGGFVTAGFYDYSVITIAPRAPQT